MVVGNIPGLGLGFSPCGNDTVTDGVSCQVIIILTVLVAPCQRPALILEHEVRRLNGNIRVNQRATSDTGCSQDAYPVIFRTDSEKQSAFSQMHHVIKTILFPGTANATEKDVDNAFEVFEGRPELN